MHSLQEIVVYILSTETEAYVRKYARSGTSASREALGMAGRRKRPLSSLIISGEAAEALLPLAFL
jgi:hypothetical protein